METAASPTLPKLYWISFIERQSGPISSKEAEEQVNWLGRIAKQIDERAKVIKSLADYDNAIRWVAAISTTTDHPENAFKAAWQKALADDPNRNKVWNFKIIEASAAQSCSLAVACDIPDVATKDVAAALRALEAPLKWQQYAFSDDKWLIELEATDQTLTQYQMISEFKRQIRNALISRGERKTFENVQGLTFNNTEFPKKTIYFGHPKGYYDSGIEKAWIAQLESQGYDVINPGNPDLQSVYGGQMAEWQRLAASCDEVAILPFPDGKWGAGVAEEAKAALAANKPLWVCSPHVGGLGIASMEQVKAVPEESILTIEDTRERNRLLLEARNQPSPPLTKCPKLGR